MRRDRFDAPARAGGRGGAGAQRTGSPRPTLLALEGTAYTNQASLTFSDRNGCTYPPVTASGETRITVIEPTGDPLSQGFWAQHLRHRRPDAVADHGRHKTRYSTATTLLKEINMARSPVF